MSNQKIIYDYAMSLLLVPYRWAGQNPLEGLDCSQLVIEIASAIGLAPPVDMTAQSLYEYYLHHGRLSDPELGCLAFFGKSLKEISHTAFCLSKTHMIEAGGGNQTTINFDVAKKQGAFVRVRPIRNRSDMVSVVMPSWPNFDAPHL